MTTHMGQDGCFLALPMPQFLAQLSSAHTGTTERPPWFQRYFQHTEQSYSGTSNPPVVMVAAARPLPGRSPPRSSARQRRLRFFPRASTLSPRTCDPPTTKVVGGPKTKREVLESLVLGQTGCSDGSTQDPRRKPSSLLSFSAAAACGSVADSGDAHTIGPPPIPPALLREVAERENARKGGDGWG